MKPFGQDEGVKIDHAHAELLRGLIMSNKPSTVLEIGLGGGASADAMLEGLAYNQLIYDYTIVDNWMDWGGVCPDGVEEKYSDRCRIITMGEREFVFGTDKKWDFIMSDGDHHNTDQWFEYVYHNLLNPGGILVYHDVHLRDVADGFPNLRQIYFRCREFGIPHHLFNADSRPDERCWRGLLVIFKPKE
jgi:predicted O-methyltransferase YrrM